MLKKPTLARNSRRKTSNPIKLKNQLENFNNNDSINNLDKKSEKKNESTTKSPKPVKNKSFKRMNTSKLLVNNKEERNNKNFRIVKEVFDPKKYIITEEELFRQGEGYCFGEFALIYNEPRSASIYTLEDCVFFTLDEIHFKNSFLKSLNNSESNKKIFALKNFLPFDMTNTNQLSIYKNIIQIICKKNQTVFNEGDKSDSIFLIYLGSFILEKKYGNKQFKVLNLEKGSIVGLESIFEGEDSKYKCSLKLSMEYDVGLIFQLKINKLRPYMLKQMIKSFKMNYEVFLKSWNDLFYKNVIMQQKITNEKNEDIIGEEGKNDYLYYLNENNEQFELNCDLFNMNWNSVLNLEQEDKYEVLFRDCLKTKYYDNHKKDGSLRIFSSKQMNKMFEYNNKNNNNYKKINLLKSFHKYSIDKINSKHTNSLTIKKLKNIDEGSQSNINNKTLKNIENNLNLSENKKDNILMDIEESTNELFVNKEESNKFNQKEHLLIKTNPKKILYYNNIIKDTNQNESEKNKYMTIHFSNNLIKTNKMTNNEKDNYFNKQNIQLKEKKLKQNIKYIFNKRIKIKVNDKIPSKANNLFLNEINNKSSITFRESIKDKNVLYRNNSFLHFNKNISIEKNIDENIIVNDTSNQILSKKLNESNSCKNNLRSKLLSSRKIQYENLSNRNNNISNKKYSNLEKKHNSLLNIKAKNLFITFNKEKIKEKIKNKRKNILDKNKVFKIIKNSNSIKNKILKNSFYNEENKNNSKELNLKNGFSVSYIEKIKHINNINNFELTHKNKPFQSSFDNFKVSFDSGGFKIPLISSSVRLKKI